MAGTAILPWSYPSTICQEGKSEADSIFINLTGHVLQDPYLSWAKIQQRGCVQLLKMEVFIAWISHFNIWNTKKNIELESWIKNSHHME
jgi:hypothetical protein